MLDQLKKILFRDSNLSASIPVTKRISGDGNELHHRNAHLTNVTFDIQGSRNTVSIAEDCVLNGVTFYIRGENHRIEIGKECKLLTGTTIWVEDHDCTVSISDKTQFYGYTSLTVLEAGTKLTIGRNCLFAFDIDIRCSDSHSIIDRNTGLKINKAKDINIGNHVWVAGHCIILKGATISDDSVVAAGSVVTRGSAEKGVILAGNPAQIVKKDITWSWDRNYSAER